MAESRGLQDPQEDYEWLAEHVELSPRACPSVAKVRLDGWMWSTPNYTDAYAAAWQALLPRAQELAIPILYLQRHTLELIAKDILKLLLDIRQERGLAHEIFGLPEKVSVVPSADWDADWKRAHIGHKLGPLLDTVSKNLVLLDLPSLPDDFKKAKSLFDELERGDVTRLRYATVPVGGNQVRSFEGTLSNPIVADLGEFSGVLTRIVSEHCCCSEERTEPPSFMHELVRHSESVNYDLRQQLDALEAATARGEVAWEETRNPPLDKSDFAEGAERLNPRYLVTTYQGRRLVILMIRDGLTVDGTDGVSRQDAYYVACQRADGTVSRKLCPTFYESSVVAEACDSLRRSRHRVPV